MNNEEQQSLRIAIAEDQGWNHWFNGWNKLEDNTPPLTLTENLPNYTTSLDAIWQAVQGKGIRFKKRFEVNLYKTKYKFICELTALDWCICYKETLQELKKNNQNEDSHKNTKDTR